MKETKYYCDKCKKEVATLGELITTQIKIEPHNIYSSARQKFKSISSCKEYCDDCAEKLGFIKKEVIDQKIIYKPTTAEKLYDLVAEIAKENSQV